MKLIVLQDSSTSGVAELLASALKRHGKAKTWGSQTAGLGVALGRIPLSQGGALEIVMERWTGAGREEVDQTGVKADKPIKDFGPQDRLIDFILDTLNDTVQGSKAS
jgi:C-terminal processing protease CtpA/Prc